MSGGQISVKIKRLRNIFIYVLSDYVSYSSYKKLGQAIQSPVLLTESMLNKGGEDQCALLSDSVGSSSFTNDGLTGTCTVY